MSFWGNTVAFQTRLFFVDAPEAEAVGRLIQGHRSTYRKKSEDAHCIDIASYFALRRIGVHPAFPVVYRRHIPCCVGHWVRIGPRPGSWEASLLSLVIQTGRRLFERLVRCNVSFHLRMIPGLSKGTTPSNIGKRNRDHCDPI